MLASLSSSVRSDAPNPVKHISRASCLGLASGLFLYTHCQPSDSDIAVISSEENGLLAKRILVSFSLNMDTPKLKSIHYCTLRQVAAPCPILATYSVARMGSRKYQAFVTKGGGALSPRGKFCKQG